MISDAKFIELDAEIWGLMVPERGPVPSREGAEPLDAALPQLEVAPDAADERRIERIIEKARFEAVVKDSVSFLFKTMGAGASELAAGVIAAASGEARSAGAAEAAEAEPPQTPEDTEDEQPR